LVLTHADTLTDRVVKVANGDTITVLDDSYRQHKIQP
jgi:3-phenylpropionate/cinnamic acid dioxygenase small subunit